MILDISLEFHYLVSLGPYAVLLGAIDGVGAVARVDALDQMDFAVVIGVHHHVDTSAVERDRISGGEDTEVSHLCLCGVAVAVAVDGKIIGYVDVDDIIAAMVCDSLAGICHRFEEVVLLSREGCRCAGLFGLTGRVDVCLALSRSYAD